ncbi:hypothetical protein [Janibacter limosus]|uniref:hypothetical protein n=1 Tax=Janibacter limosus TaxID=53458 RepID=UPI000835D58D|nr:hypothetical protein [Janibacter limosus]
MKTFVRWTFRIIVGFFALMLLIYVVSGLVGMAQVHGAKGDALESVRMLERDTGTTDQIVQDNRATLGEPERSWSQVVCEIGSNDGGWMVNDYTQLCSRQVVDVYPASVLSQAEGLADLSEGVRVSECTQVRCTEPVTTQPSVSYRTSVGTEPVWDVNEDVDGGSHTVVTVHGPRSTTVLGCSPWGVVLCSAPVDQPLMPQD